ncbi:MAG: hydantoinase B/oxoprolinase family protein [Haloplanus sp.]
MTGETDGQSADAEVDPATLEVVRNACVAVAEEMNATLVRTSYSPNIKERKDCSCALFDPEGRMVAQAENMPVHLGAMPYSVEAALAEHPLETLQPGDAILVNDPYHGGAHLPDLTLVTPIHVDGEPVAVAANRAHHADIGGATPGSVGADSTEIYQEGLRIPPVKLYERGRPNDAVFDLITINVRTPGERSGDLRAQQAANETARERVEELVRTHGADGLSRIFAEILSYSERRMRATLDGLPDGTYEFEDALDGDGRSDDPVPIRAAVTVDGESIDVDFSGTARQVDGPINAVEAVTASATYYAVRCVTDPDIPPNHGCYRPIEITAPEGTIVNASPPAAVVGGNLETSQRTVDVVLGALAQAAPERSAAAGQGTMNNVTFGGVDAQTGEPYTFYETQAGGFGGRGGSDGMDAVHVHMSNTMNTPVEVLEDVYPLRVERYELRPDSGGAGAYRGGLGLRRDITPVGHDADVSVLADRQRTRPYGLFGGEPGECGAVALLTEDGETAIESKSSLIVAAGETLSIRTPGGGGYGDPVDRDPAAVLEDVRRGVVTPAAAREQYGVIVEERDGAYVVNDETTARHRSNRCR